MVVAVNIYLVNVGLVQYNVKMQNMSGKIENHFVLTFSRLDFFLTLA